MSRFTVKYNPANGVYGTYDHRQREITWLGGKAAAASDVARKNAAVSLEANLRSAIGNIATILTGEMTAERRGHYEEIREQLRGVCAVLPEVR